MREKKKINVSEVQLKVKVNALGEVGKILN